MKAHGALPSEESYVHKRKRETEKQITGYTKDQKAETDTYTLTH